MSLLVIPGCSMAELHLFRPNSTLDTLFREFNDLTRSAALKSILATTVLYFLLNVFHLIILTRPTMRSLSVSNEMILIAACGIVSGMLGVAKNIVEFIEDEYFCVHTYFYQVVVIIDFTLFQVINQIILWEIVYITFLRAAIILDVRHGIKTDNAKKYMRRLIYTFFGIFLMNHLFRISLQRIVVELDPEEIERQKAGAICDPKTVYNIGSIAGNCVKRITLGISAITSLMIPIVIMCLLSIFLVFELRTSSELSTTSSQSSNRQNSAARALLLFLCFYVLAELPYAVLFGVGLYNPADFEQMDEYIYTQVDNFIFVNMCLGILVYCLMSSQYRETIRITFFNQNKVMSGEQNSRTTS